MGNKDKKLMVLIGLPASGKSTYFNKLKAENPKAVHWSRDSIVEKYAKDHNATYDYAYNNFTKEIDESYKVMTKMLRENKPYFIICDKTNLRSNVRDKEFISFKEYGYHITYVFFESPRTESEYETWYGRINSRKDKSIPHFVLEDMKNNYCDYVPEDARVIPDEVIRIRNWSE